MRNYDEIKIITINDVNRIIESCYNEAEKENHDIHDEWSEASAYHKIRQIFRSQALLKKFLRVK